MYKAFRITVNNRKAIIAAPDGREKGHQQPLPEEQRNWTKNSIFFQTKIQINMIFAYISFYGVCTKKSLL